jgi:hypothetical protein
VFTPIGPIWSNTITRILDYSTEAIWNIYGESAAIVRGSEFNQATHLGRLRPREQVLKPKNSAATILMHKGA